MTRPTIHDVADAAQVSLATVDRVLNSRGGVAAKSVEKVKRAIEETGYVRDQAAANMSRNRSYRICFMLPDTPNTFLDQLCDGITSQEKKLRQDRVSIAIQRVEAFSASAFADALNAIPMGKVDAVALMSVESPEIHDAINQLRKRGVHVVSVVSDLPHAKREHYVGPNNVISGRTAAEFMGRFVPQGDILLLAGASTVRDHVERRMGFEAVMQQDFPHLRVTVATDGADDAVQNYDRLNDGFAKKPFNGVYNVGAGNSGLIAALQDIPSAKRPVTILHELTPTTRDAMRQGFIDLVIDQNPAEEVARTIRILRDLMDGHPLPAQAGLIQPQIFITQNLP